MSSRIIIGSGHLVGDAPCPVLVVPSPSEAPAADPPPADPARVAAEA